MLCIELDGSVTAGSVRRFLWLPTHGDEFELADGRQLILKGSWGAWACERGRR